MSIGWSSEFGLRPVFSRSRLPLLMLRVLPLCSLLTMDIAWPMVGRMLMARRSNGFGFPSRSSSSSSSLSNWWWSSPSAVYSFPPLCSKEGSPSSSGGSSNTSHFLTGSMSASLCAKTKHSTTHYRLLWDYSDCELSQIMYVHRTQCTNPLYKGQLEVPK